MKDFKISGINVIFYSFLAACAMFDKNWGMLICAIATVVYALKDSQNK